MDFLVKCITFIPKLIMEIVLYPIKKLFGCLISLLIFLILLVAASIYIYTHADELAEKDYGVILEYWPFNQIERVPQLQQIQKVTE